VAPMATMIAARESTRIANKTFINTGSRIPEQGGQECREKGLDPYREWLRMPLWRRGTAFKPALQQ
jgi:hypothetical protein